MIVKKIILKIYPKKMWKLLSNKIYEYISRIYEYVSIYQDLRKNIEK